MSTRLLMIHDNIKTISALLAPLWGIQWLPVESPHNGTGMWNFRVFLAVSLDKLRNIQPRCRWLETPCRPWMWRQCDVIVDNSQIAKFMGPTWVPPGSYRPHEPCYQGNHPLYMQVVCRGALSVHVVSDNIRSWLLLKKESWTLPW